MRQTRTLDDKKFLLRVGEILKGARIKQGMTQTQLGKRVGFDKSYISKMANGKKSIRLDTLLNIVVDGLAQKLFIRFDNKDYYLH